MNRQGKNDEIKLSGNKETGEEEKISYFSSCISPESLSAFADREYMLTEEEQKHLASCTHCRKRLFFLQKMNNTLHTLLQKECPASLIDLMSEKVRYRIKMEEKNTPGKKLRFSPGRMFIHAAAALVLFSLIAYLVMDNPNENILPLPEEKISSIPSAGKQEQSPTSTPSPYFQLAKMPSSNVDIRNLAVLSSSADPVEFLQSMDTRRKEKVVSIEKNVKQIWLYDTKKHPVFSEEMEKSLIERAGRKNVKRISGTNRNAPAYTVITTKKGAVRLVRFLAEKGFRLITPMQPQPEQKYFFGKGDEKTVMELQFLPSKD